MNRIPGVMGPQQEGLPMRLKIKHHPQITLKINKTNMLEYKT